MDIASILNYVALVDIETIKWISQNLDSATQAYEKGIQLVQEMDNYYTEMSENWTQQQQTEYRTMQAKANLYGKSGDNFYTESDAKLRELVQRNSLKGLEVLDEEARSIFNKKESAILSKANFKEAWDNSISRIDINNKW